MNKKNLIIIGSLTLLLLSLFLILKPDQESELKKTIPASGGVLKVSRVGTSNIYIIPSHTNDISFDLKGDSKDLDRVRFSTLGNNTELIIPDNTGAITGTIYVPEGMLVDLPYKNDSAPDSGSSNFIRLGGGSPYQSVTLEEDQISFNNSPHDSGGNPSVPTNGNPSTNPNMNPPGTNPPNPQPDPTEPNPVPPVQPPIVPINPDPEPPIYENDPVGYTPEQCTIKLKQEYRNECCQQTNEETPDSGCDYGGYWLFNYHTRLCFYHCFHPCNAGTQEERDSCCADENYYASTPGCIGNWKFDNTVRTCEYQCLSEEELESYYNQDDPLEYRDFVSEACSSHNNPNECCDYNLKNQLSIGPHPGFPDCIGRWEFPVGTLGCNFRCSDYGEMMDILKQLQDQKNN